MKLEIVFKTNSFLTLQWQINESISKLWVDNISTIFKSNQSPNLIKTISFCNNIEKAKSLLLELKQIISTYLSNSYTRLNINSIDHNLLLRIHSHLISHIDNNKLYKFPNEKAFKQLMKALKIIPSLYFWLDNKQNISYGIMSLGDIKVEIHDNKTFPVSKYSTDIEFGGLYSISSNLDWIELAWNNISDLAEIEKVHISNKMESGFNIIFHPDITGADLALIDWYYDNIELLSNIISIEEIIKNSGRIKLGSLINEITPELLDHISNITDIQSMRIIDD